MLLGYFRSALDQGLADQPSLDHMRLVQVPEDHIGPDHMRPDQPSLDHIRPDHIRPVQVVPVKLEPDHMGPFQVPRSRPSRRSAWRPGAGRDRVADDVLFAVEDHPVVDQVGAAPAPSRLPAPLELV